MNRAISSRRHHNRRSSAFVGPMIGAVAPYIIGGGALYLVWAHFFGSVAKDSAAAGSSDPSAAHTVSQLLASPTNEGAVLTTDVKQAASGIAGLVGDEVTSLENGVNSGYQALKKFF